MEEIREFTDIESEKTKLCGIIYDNPNISDENKCRFDVCISKESVKGLEIADERYGSITIQ